MGTMSIDYTVYDNDPQLRFFRQGTLVAVVTVYSVRVYECQTNTRLTQETGVRVRCIDVNIKGPVCNQKSTVILK